MIGKVFKPASATRFDYEYCLVTSESPIARANSDFRWNGILIYKRSYGLDAFNRIDKFDGYQFSREHVEVPMEEFLAAYKQVIQEQIEIIEEFV